MSHNSSKAVSAPAFGATVVVSENNMRSVEFHIACPVLVGRDVGETVVRGEWTLIAAVAPPGDLNRQKVSI